MSQAEGVKAEKDVFSVEGAAASGLANPGEIVIETCEAEADDEVKARQSEYLTGWLGDIAGGRELVVVRLDSHVT